MTPPLHGMCGKHVASGARNAKEPVSAKTLWPAGPRAPGWGLG